MKSNKNILIIFSVQSLHLVGVVVRADIPDKIKATPKYLAPRG
jgi:hypothetical protein